MKVISIIIFLIGTNFYAQDTIVYKGILRGDFLLETIELFPDSTFKWTNEYDLTWSEYGNYKIADKKLILKHFIFLDYPETMSLNDSISKIDKPTKTRILEIENNRIYPVTEKGERITKMKDPYFRRKWGWLLGNRFEYKMIRIE